MSGVGEDHRKGCLAHSGAGGKSCLLSQGRRGCGFVLRLGEEETMSESQAIHWFPISFLRLVFTKNSIQRGRKKPLCVQSSECDGDLDSSPVIMEDQ